MISVSFVVAVFEHKKRQFHCRRAESPLCLFCCEEPEDEEHILWRCPRWETLCLEKQGPRNRDRLTWPPCTSRCGIFLEDPESVAWADTESSTRAQSVSCNTLPDCVLSDERFERETKNNDSVVWLGPMEHVSAGRTRGSGEQAVEFFGINDNRNCSFPLPGCEQTNNRAELLAVIATMQVHDGNLEIRSDSEYVVRIATSRTCREMQRDNEGNTDLWDEFETKLRLDATRRLDFVCVTGHAKKLHIGRHITTSLNKGGNDAADALASAAASHHAAPQALTEAAIERQRTALLTHSFAAELLFQKASSVVGSA